MKNYNDTLFCKQIANEELNERYKDAYSNYILGIISSELTSESVQISDWELLSNQLRKYLDELRSEKLISKCFPVLMRLLKLKALDLNKLFTCPTLSRQIIN